MRRRESCVMKAPCICGYRFNHVAVYILFRIVSLSEATWYLEKSPPESCLMLHRISLRRRSSLRMASTRTHHHSLLRWITGSGLLKPERAVLVSEGNCDWSDTGAGLLAGTLVTFRGSLRFPAISLRLLKSCRTQASRISFGFLQRESSDVLVDG